MQARAWRVRVSASTSNLGPGFDLAGLAIDRFLSVELRRSDANRAPTLELGRGCEEWPGAESNRLCEAFRRAMLRRRLDPRGFDFRAESDIPIGRGFGSSAAATVAGVLLADAQCARASTREELLLECIEIEGHPDNATPALHGGFTLSLAAGARAFVIQAPLHESLGFAIAWPEVQLPTALARGLLPAQVPFSDAVENPRRLAILLEGLRLGLPAWIAHGSEDRLHERYRLPHIRGASQALAAARAAGAFAAWISGSGSGLFAVGARGDEARLADALVRGFSSANASAIGAPAAAVFTTPHVVAID